MFFMSFGFIPSGKDSLEQLNWFLYVLKFKLKSAHLVYEGKFASVVTEQNHSAKCRKSNSMSLCCKIVP